MTDPFPTSGVPFFKGKKVAVTGASGLIGSYAVKLLKESGAWVRAIFHSRPPNEFTIIADSVESFDLSSASLAAPAVRGCEIVIACAGITGGVGLPGIDPVSYVGPATAIAINTLHACFEEDVDVFGYLSSTTVYEPSEEASKEDDVKHGDALYPLYRGIGHSKRFLEKLCTYYTQTTGVGTAIIRPAGAYGRFDNFDEKTSHVLPGLVERALRTGHETTFDVWGDGKDVRDFIHAQDVARCLLLATAKLQDGDPVNAASGRSVTTGELAQAVLNAAGSTAKLSFPPGKPSALRKRVVNVSKAERLLGFKAEISLEAGLRDVVAWRRENQ